MREKMCKGVLDKGEIGGRKREGKVVVAAEGRRKREVVERIRERKSGGREVLWRFAITIKHA